MLGRIAMSLLSGSSMGAALMYLLDPRHGQRRRDEVKQSAADAYDSAVAWAGPAAAHWRWRLSDRLADASRLVSPAVREGSARLTPRAERMEMSPTEAYTAMALSQRSRDLHDEAREAYARARDMYYDALIDLDLARTRGQREAPKAKAVPQKVKTESWSWGKAQQRKRPDYLTIALVAAGCCAVGAGVMFMTDPVAGRRRRALTRDKVYSVARRTSHSVRDTVGEATHRVRDYGQGRVARARAARRDEVVPDEKLVARVRAELGRAVSHPGAIHVLAKDGSVTVRGPVLASEFDALMKCVYGVPGVREVINQVDAHAEAGHVPGLQG